MFAILRSISPNPAEASLSPALRGILRLLKLLIDDIFNEAATLTDNMRRLESQFADDRARLEPFGVPLGKCIEAQRLTVDGLNNELASVTAQIDELTRDPILRFM